MPDDQYNAWQRSNPSAHAKFRHDWGPCLVFTVDVSLPRWFRGICKVLHLLQELITIECRNVFRNSRSCASLFASCSRLAKLLRSWSFVGNVATVSSYFDKIWAMGKTKNEQPSRKKTWLGGLGLNFLSQLASLPVAHVVQSACPKIRAPRCDQWKMQIGGSAFSGFPWFSNVLHSFFGLKWCPWKTTSLWCWANLGCPSHMEHQWASTAPRRWVPIRVSVTDAGAGKMIILLRPAGQMVNNGHLYCGHSNGEMMINHWVWGFPKKFQTSKARCAKGIQRP